MPSGPRIRANNVLGTTTDNPLTAGAATFNSALLTLLPVVSSAHAVVTLDPLRQFGNPEIVIVTAHSVSSTTATITRGAYGTTARSHPENTVWIHAPMNEDVIPILTSGTRPTDPYRGEMIFETDTNSYVARDMSDAWQTVVPLGAWVSWAPVVTQGVTPSKSTNYARYTRLGRLIIAQATLTFSTAGTGGQSLNVSGLPASLVNTFGAVGTWHFFDSGTNNFTGSLHPLTATTVELIQDANANAFGTTTTIANNDVLKVDFQYEATS